MTKLIDLYKLTTTATLAMENKETDTQWDLMLVDDTPTLVFPPTVSKLDWAQNFSFLAVPYKGMDKKWKAHSGFLSKYKSIQENVINLTRNYLDIMIVGFSQGAALATLAHEDLSFNFPMKKIRTVVFGSPRVVSWNAPKERWKDLIRVVNGNDIVTHIPPFMLGYSHVGKKFQIGNWNKFPNVKDHSDYPSCLDNLYYNKGVIS